MGCNQSKTDSESEVQLESRNSPEKSGINNTSSPVRQGSEFESQANNDRKIISDLNEQIKNLKEANLNLNLQIEQCQRGHTKEIKLKEQEIYDLTANNESNRKELQKEIMKNNELKEELERIKNIKLNEQNKGKAEQESQINILKLDNDNLQRRNMNLEVEFQRQREILQREAASREKSLTDKIHQLESQLSSLKEENLQLKNKLLELSKAEAQKQQNYQLTESDLNKKINVLTGLAELLRKEKNEFEDKIKQLAEANRGLEEEVSDLKRQLEAKSRQALESKQQNGYKARTDDRKIEASPVPCCSIRLKTVFALQRNGWSVTQTLPEQVKQCQTKKLPLIGMVGAGSSGKSWLCYSISSVPQPYEHGGSSNTISLQYMGSNRAFFGVLDFKGYDAPLQANDDSILGDLSEELRTNEKASETLLDNAVLIEELNLDYLVDQSGIIIFVADKFTYNDNVILQKLHRKLKQCYSKRANAGMPQLFIVHNFKQLYSISEVEKELRNLEKSFVLNKEPLFNDIDKSLIGRNLTLWKDCFGYTHLIAAAADSEAGQHYNLGTLKFLSSKINTLERKTELNFAASYSRFCNHRLPLMLETDLEVKYDSKENRIVDAKKTKINPAHLSLYNPAKNIFASADFTPGYSVSRKQENDKTMLVAVEIDVLNSRIDKTSLLTKNGWTYLTVKGQRVNPFQENGSDDDLSEERLKGTRQFGPFELMIKLVQGMISVKEKTKKYEPVNGTLKIEFCFTPAEDQML